MATDVHDRTINIFLQRVVEFQKISFIEKDSFNCYILRYCLPKK